jgi:hypothetical protein
MVRLILGVIGGFVAWLLVWVGIEKVLTAISPGWFGAQQQAFQAAIENGGTFDPDTAFLLTQIVSASVVSIVAGFLAALIAGENRRAPMILGFLLLAMGLSKAVMSWAVVPIWYHIVFTAVLIPMTILGGRLKKRA